MPLVEPPYTLPGAWTNCYIPLNSQRKAMDVRWLPTLPGPPFLGSLIINRAALHLLRNIDLAWPSISGLPSTDEFLLSYAGLPG